MARQQQQTQTQTQTQTQQQQQTGATHQSRSMSRVIWGQVAWAAHSPVALPLPAEEVHVSWEAVMSVWVLNAPEREDVFPDAPE